MLTMVKDFAHEDSGATAIEYGLIAALIALVIIGGLSALGGENGGLFNFVKNEVSGAIDGARAGDGGGEGTDT